MIFMTNGGLQIKSNNRLILEQSVDMAAFLFLFKTPFAVLEKQDHGAC